MYNSVFPIFLDLRFLEAAKSTRHALVFWFPWQVCFFLNAVSLGFLGRFFFLNKLSLSEAKLNERSSDVEAKQILQRLPDQIYGSRRDSVAGDSSCSRIPRHGFEKKTRPQAT